MAASGSDARHATIAPPKASRPPLTFVIFPLRPDRIHNREMKLPTFVLDKADTALSDPETLADRLAAFLHANICLAATDRDLLLIFVDRLFLALCDDFSDDELKQGARIQFEPLNDQQIASLRALHAQWTQQEFSARTSLQSQAAAAD